LGKKKKEGNKDGGSSSKMKIIIELIKNVTGLHGVRLRQMVEPQVEGEEGGGWGQYLLRGDSKVFKEKTEQTVREVRGGIGRATQCGERRTTKLELRGQLEAPRVPL